MIANKGLRIRGTLQNVQSDVTTGTGDDLKGKVSRKKFAVFVSGGGSNFKSLHEAIANGSIYGDITVLVTNKPGIFFLFLFAHSQVSSSVFFHAFG